MKTIRYNGYEWYVIKEDEEKAVLFMKNRLSKEEMTELFDDSVLDDDKDVKYGLINNKWQDSIIRFTLNSKWLSKFNKDELVVMEHNDGKSITNDYVKLLSIEEAKELPKDVLKVDDKYGYWLGSADYDYDVWGVGSTSDFYYGYFHDDNRLGVRPVITVYKSNIPTGSDFSEKIGTDELEEITVYKSDDIELVVDRINKIIKYLKGK